jgi:REP element-mobilizing transposase RayT
VHGLICNRVHVIFSTAERRALIPDALQPHLWAYLGGIAKHSGAIALAIGGTRDHVHILLSLSSRVALSEVVQKLKANSSHWVSEVGKVPLFSWQRGFGAFSVGNSGLQATIKYILTQPEHHRKRNYTQEWDQILRQHGIAFSSDGGGIDTDSPH